MLRELLTRALNGRKVYLAALGLTGLAIYQASTGDYAAAVESILAALGAAGLRHSIQKAAGV